MASAECPPGEESSALTLVRAPLRLCCNVSLYHDDLSRSVVGDRVQVPPSPLPPESPLPETPIRDFHIWKIITTAATVRRCFEDQRRTFSANLVHGR